MEWTSENMDRETLAYAGLEAFFGALTTIRGYENVKIPQSLRESMVKPALRAVMIFDILNDSVKADFWAANYSYTDSGHRISHTVLFETEQEANDWLKKQLLEVTNMTEDVDAGGRYDYVYSDDHNNFYGEVLPVDKPGVPAMPTS